jgi:hypothetical protein
VTVTQRAGLLDIQPFLKTACVEEMTAGRDHSRLHVLKEGQKEPYKCPPSTFTATPRVLALTFLSNRNRKSVTQILEQNSFYFINNAVTIRDSLIKII